MLHLRFDPGIVGAMLKTQVVIPTERSEWRNLQLFLPRVGENPGAILKLSSFLQRSRGPAFLLKRVEASQSKAPIAKLARRY
jgi:hypothetical protein